MIKTETKLLLKKCSNCEGKGIPYISEASTAVISHKIGILLSVVVECERCPNHWIQTWTLEGHEGEKDGTH